MFNQNKSNNVKNNESNENKLQQQQSTPKHFNLDINLFTWNDETQTAYYNGKELKQTSNTQGYKYVTINGQKHRVHRLIGYKYLTPEFPHYNVIDHLNGIKDDNRIANLEWVTQSINMQRAFQARGKQTQAKYKYTITHNESGETYQCDTLQEIAEIVERSYTAIRGAAKGEWSLCNGYKIDREEIVNNESI